MNSKNYREQLSDVIDSPSSHTMMLQKQKYSDQSSNIRKFDQIKVIKIHTYIFKQIRKQVKSTKPILLIQWEESQKKFRFAIDVLKYVSLIPLQYINLQKTLFKVLPSQYIIYVNVYKEVDLNYLDSFKEYINTEYVNSLSLFIVLKAIHPFLQLNLNPRIMALEYSHLQRIQEYCLLLVTMCPNSIRIIQHVKNQSESFILNFEYDPKHNHNQILLQISYLLATQLVFVADSDFSAFQDYLSNLQSIKQNIQKEDNNTVPYELPQNNNSTLIDFKPQCVVFQLDNSSIINLDDLKQYFSSIKGILIEYDDNNDKKCADTIRRINTILCNQGITKIFQSINIDFYIFLSILQNLSNESNISNLLSNQYLQNIFDKAIKSQLEMAKSDCLFQYDFELKQFCSSHEQRQLMKVKQFLLDIRFFILSKFQTMMLAYQNKEVYRDYLKELKEVLREKEEQCIEYFKRVIFKFNDFINNMIDSEYQQQVNYIREQHLKLKEKHECLEVQLEKFSESYKDFFEEFIGNKNMVGELQSQVICEYLQKEYPQNLKKFLSSYQLQYYKEFQKQNETLIQQELRLLESKDNMQEKKVDKIDCQVILKQIKNQEQYRDILNIEIENIKKHKELMQKQNEQKLIEMKEHLYFVEQLQMKENELFALRNEYNKLRREI